MNRARNALAAGLFLAVGLGAAAYLHWPALTDFYVYKSDVRQSPHWAAYHTDTFRDDDLLLTLARHNESPVQNLIYWIGTHAVDMITLGKWLAVAGYGLTAALFFWVGQSMFGFRVGVLAALCFTFLPDQFEYYAGGFSKAWMIPLILLAVRALERGTWRHLLLLMPFGAAAYPVSAVMIGAIALTFLLLETPEKGKQALPAWGWLSAASGLALAVLFAKYLAPPEGIGSLTPGSVLRQMPEMYRGGMWRYLPLPTLSEELAEHFAQPFVVFSAVVFFLRLGRQGVVWSRGMTALLLPSLVLYLVASAAFMHFYQPDRYTRYSLAVLLVLWHARNWDRVLDSIPWKGLRTAALAALLAFGGYLCWDTFRMGKDTSPRHEWIALNDFVATLPPKVLVAGHPEYMDDIPILARRSVLCDYKLAHPWYSEYYPEIRRRTEATFDALYAAAPEPVNRLAQEWGVTHLVVVRRYLDRDRIRARNIYVDPYNDYIAQVAGAGGPFLLADPPRGHVVYEDSELYVVELPLATRP